MRDRSPATPRVFVVSRRRSYRWTTARTSANDGRGSSARRLCSDPPFGRRWDAAARGLRPTLELSNAAGRVWLAARLYHAGLAPRITVSGGSFPAADSAALMSEAESIRPLLQYLGVPSDAIRPSPDRSMPMETLKNPAVLIGDQEKVALHLALHVPRAMREMQAAGITAHPFPTHLQKAPRASRVVSAVVAEPRCADIVDARYERVAGNTQHLDYRCSIAEREAVITQLSCASRRSELPACDNAGSPVE